MTVERTLIIIKPDGVKGHLAEKIVERYTKAGLKVIAQKKIKATHKLLTKHYSAHIGKPFFEGLLNFMSSGKVIAYVLEGKNAVQEVRRITGATDPSKAEKGTVRGDFGTDSGEKADAEDRSIENLVHASGNVEEANKEISLWFSDLEQTKVLIDTNIYGWAVEDKNVSDLLLKLIEEKKQGTNSAIVFGFDIIKKELENNPHTPTKLKTLELYRSVISKHLGITKDTRMLAESYFESCKSSKLKITIEDCEIIAAAVINCIEFVVTNNRRTMNNPRTIEVIEKINDGRFKTPKIIDSKEAISMFSS